MTANSQRNYVINAADIVFEDYEDETVLANMKAGVFYTLNLIGADFLQTLIQAPYVDRAREWLVARYPSRRDEVPAMLQALIQELVSESILLEVPADEAAADSRFESAQQRVDPDAAAVPELSKFTHLDDLLKLDPVHEVVHQSGWPTASDKIG